MGENGCLKDAKFRFFESVGPAKFGHGIKVGGAAAFGRSIYVDDTITLKTIHKGHLYSTIEAVNGQDANAFVPRDPERGANGLRANNGSTIEFKFDGTLPKNAVISDLSIRIIGNASFNSSSGWHGGATNLKLGASGELFNYTNNEEKFISTTPFLNGSDDGLEAGKTYSLIKDNNVIQSNKLRDQPVWYNASQCFNGSYEHPINSSALVINTLFNASEETQPILIIQASADGAGVNSFFRNNCSIQAFITYDSPYSLETNPDPRLWDSY